MTPMLRRLYGLAAVGLTAFTLPMTALAQTGGTATRYGNVVNSRFATVSNGPQSALIVDVDAASGRAAATSGDPVRAAVKNLWSAQGRSYQNLLAKWKSTGVLKRTAVLPISTVIIERQNGKLVLPARTRAAGTTRQAFGGGTLTFTFSGFSSADQAMLQEFLNLIYPRLVNVYGAPAISGNVEIDSLGTGFTDVQGVSLGAYDASTNKILIPEYSQVSDPQSSMRAALLLNMAHAFHGPLVMQYDAWEQGMARAAASIVLRDAGVRSYLASVNSSYATDPTAGYFYDLLSFYDLLNQPALGNSTFFPPALANTAVDSTGGKMFLPRLSMAGAAWLKVYVENQSFFSQFNNDYYTQASANASVAGNVPALRATAAKYAPNVEGLPFNQWFTQQYILDSSITVGTKLYATALPEDVQSDGTQSVAIALEYFKTGSDGNETLLTGNAYATYLDDTNAVNHFGAASEAAAIRDGEGFLSTLESPTSFDARRIAMDFVVDQVSARTYVPLGFTTDFQGVILGNGATSGTFAVQQTTTPPQVNHSASVSYSRSAFGAQMNLQPQELGVTIATVTSNGTTTTYRFNAGDGKYYAILRNGITGGAATTASHSFSKTALPQLVTFPIQPLAASPDTALGLASTDFLLFAWDNSAGAYQTFVPGQNTFPRIEAGRGYWLNVGPQNTSQNAATVQISGNPAPTDTDYAVAVPFGWSLIGSPFASDVTINNIRVQLLQNDPGSYFWSDAATDGLIVNEPYGFDQTQGYVQTNTLAGSQWQGYWVRVYVPSGLTLLIPGPNAPSRAATRSKTTTRSATVVPAVPRTLPRAQWQVNMTAHQDTGGIPFTNTSTATLGGAQGATRAFDPRIDRELPPTITSAVQIEFVRADWGTGRAATSGHYIADYRSVSEAQQGATWDMRVTTPTNGTASLTWSGVGTAPRKTRLTLIDTVTGARIPLQSRSNYTWTGEAGKTRAFQVISEPERSLPLAITNLNVVPQTRAAGVNGGGAGMTFGYSVMGDPDATVEVTVATAGGRVLRRLSDDTTTPGRSATAGTQHTIHWDGRSDSGAPLPVGAYMLTITAHSTDGSTARLQRSIIMVR